MRLLSDFHPKGAMAQAYGAYIEERGHANRSVVIVDAEGTVRWTYVAEKPSGFPEPELILDALEGL
jgi:alkyl hydroperoxide reductase subunit AhpC